MKKVEPTWRCPQCRSEYYNSFRHEQAEFKCLQCGAMCERFAKASAESAWSKELSEILRELYRKFNGE